MTDDPTLTSRLAATVRRLRNSSFRPFGVTMEEEREVVEAGLMGKLSLRFGSVRYWVTEAGHEFLSEH